MEYAMQTRNATEVISLLFAAKLVELQEAQGELQADYSDLWTSHIEDIKSSTVIARAFTARLKLLEEAQGELRAGYSQLWWSCIWALVVIQLAFTGVYLITRALCDRLLHIKGELEKLQ